MSDYHWLLTLRRVLLWVAIPLSVLLVLMAAIRFARGAWVHGTIEVLIVLFGWWLARRGNVELRRRHPHPESA